MTTLRSIFHNLSHLKNTFYILLFLLTSLQCYSQKYQYTIEANSKTEQKVIDSLNYQKIHTSKKSLQQTSDKLVNNLKELGYINAILSNYTISNDTLANAKAELNTQIKYVLIYKDTISTQNKNKPINRDSIMIPFASVSSYLQSYTKSLELQGYSMAKVKLSQFRESGKTLIANLVVEKGRTRKINEIVLNYKSFPKGHQNNIERLFKNLTFTQNNVEKIKKEFDKLPFVQQTKNPEILFTTDTTKVYIYLEKANSNKFDGIVGFSNDEESGKLLFNGYVDLELNNALKTGETFILYWKSDGQKQTTFKSSIELPYIFKTPFALKASLNIFKQDSTFQNTKTSAEVGYYFSYNKRFFAGYQSTESSDIQNLNSSILKDYKSTFFTASFEYSDYRPEFDLFKNKTVVTIKSGIGNRTSLTERIPQLFIETNIENNFYLNNKNIVWIKNTNYFLQSKEYIVGELYRFGGSRSIRGFAENLLQANLALLLATEYRYLLSPTLYAHSILDYGFYSDDTQIVSRDNSNSLVGVGLGFGIVSKIGLFNLSYANGFLTNQSLSSKNSIVHISFNTTF